MAHASDHTLLHHLSGVKDGGRCFESSFQGVTRMILEGNIAKVTVTGKTTYDAPEREIRGPAGMDR